MAVQVLYIHTITPVLIVSYETLRTHVGVLGNTPIGLMLCDEGHRLKNSESQTFQAINNLNVKRRVILTGTPVQVCFSDILKVQNDLSEYFSLLNFANPNFFGTPAEFRKKYEIPILQGRDADASEIETKLSKERLLELTTQASKIIIRRTNDILSKYLPVKHEHVVFCQLGKLQTELYKLYIKSSAVKRLLYEEEVGKEGSGLQPLKAITLLKKLCNDPRLLELPSQMPGSEKVIPDDWNDAGGRKRDGNLKYIEGKMVLLDRMLTKIKENREKIVLISNYTQTLDLFETLCRSRKFFNLKADH